ncbi:major facilitator superfamily domain-containing protein [Xylogone sp. PMI_703]|nr:major facilitator superfamily domain-containing protein [Xylogone sp. PMI_703]
MDGSRKHEEDIITSHVEDNYGGGLPHEEHSSGPVVPVLDGTDYRELLPRPSNDPNDPLNWSWAQKHTVLAIVAMMAFQGGFDAGSASAGFVQQSESYGVPVAKMLNTVSVLAIFMAFGALLWVPLSHRYGRRPVYFCSAVIAALGNLAGALAKTYAAFIGSRVIVGVGCSAGVSLGGLVVKDMFFVHERGRKIGIWTMCFAVSPYIAVVLDGIITLYAGWRWMMWLTFLLWCPMIILSVVCLPESLYYRENLSIQPVPEMESYIHRLRLRKFNGNLTLKSFYKPFLLWKYPSIMFPAIYYGNLFGFCAFGTLGILPLAFVEIYGFGPLEQGLMAIPLLIGTVLGEPLGGPLSDWMVNHLAKKNNGIRYPEQRLRALWFGAPLVSVGLMMFALFLHFKVHWVGPCFAIIIFSVGMQVVLTVVVTYAVDCYENLAGEIGLISNVGRQLFSFNIYFYFDSFIERAGYGWVFGTFALLSFFLFGLMISLMIWGQVWRQKLGTPVNVEGKNAINQVSRSGEEEGKMSL